VSLRTEAYFQHFSVGDSPTVAWIRDFQFHRVGARITGLIRKKPGLIRIKSPVHRRKIKRPNRPNCGHDDRQERIVVCWERKNPCFDPKNPDSPLTGTDEDFGDGYINRGKWGVRLRSSTVYAKIFYQKNPVGLVKKFEREKKLKIFSHGNFFVLL